MAHEDEESGAGELGAAGEIDDAELLAQVPVRLWDEVKGGNITPLSDYHVVLFAFAVGHVGLGDVGEAEKEVVQLGLNFVVLLVEVVNLLPDLSHFGNEGRSVAGHTTDGPAGLVSVGAKPVRLGLKVSTLFVEGNNFD